MSVCIPLKISTGLDPVDHADQRAFRLRAPAKLNLALHITGQRHDGYHLLDSLVMFTDFGDSISVALAEHDSFTITGAYSHLVPVTPDNLVMKARDSLRELHPDQARPVAIKLEKHLPVASGIGGGSSDAATVLHLLLDLWQIELSPSQLQILCLQLGADVAMCLHGQRHGQALRVRGIGEELQVVNDLPALPIVLINDGTALSTPQIFRSLHKRDNPALPPVGKFATISDLCHYLNTTRNDLFNAATLQAPDLPRILSELTQAGAEFSQMSGSGATCFGIFINMQAAQTAATLLKTAQPHWFVQATTTLPLQTLGE